MAETAWSIASVNDVLKEGYLVLIVKGVNKVKGVSDELEDRICDLEAVAVALWKAEPCPAARDAFRRIVNRMRGR
ncbi:MAG: hypothetical protein JRE40_03385 [Deltaproteobacteria bacterium]|nr:hypothetical protein [Deltaproteobacteria bacterium]MBW2672987.1 hypothetical protein [Deltaproteobacteria bacterium]